MAEQGETPPGLIESAKRLLDTVVGTVQDRFELVATEFQEELARLTALLVWAFAAMLALGIGLTFVAVTVILAFAPEHRAAAAGTLAAIFLAAAGGAAFAVRQVVRSKSRAFDASLNELAKDRERLRSAS